MSFPADTEDVGDAGEEVRVGLCGSWCSAAIEIPEMVVMVSFSVLGPKTISVVFVIYESDPSDWITLAARGVASATTPLLCGVDAGAAISRGFGDKKSGAPVCQQPKLLFCVECLQLHTVLQAILCTLPRGLQSILGEVLAHRRRGFR